MNGFEARDLCASEFSEHINKDLGEGLHSVLFKPISGITVNDSAIGEAFREFISSAEQAESFTVGDMIFGAETVIKGCEPEAADGNAVWCIDKTGSGRCAKKLLKNSVGGIYALFGLRNGLCLDIDAMGGSLPSAEIKRFAVMPLSKGAKLAAHAASEGIKMVECGTVLSANSVIIKRGREVIASFDRSILFPRESAAISLGEQYRGDFADGYKALCTYSACRAVSENVIIRFGLGGGIENVCARALGYFKALMIFKTIPVNIVFTAESVCDVAVPRPNAADGDYLFLLRVREDGFGMPDKIHLGQLCYYLGEMKRRGIIKDVLPIKKNVDATIERLCGKNLEYCALADIPDRCPGVIVSVRRGDSVNGIRLGYFKNTF